MTLLDTFLIPFVTSIFANFSTDKIKDIFTKNSIEKYEKSFINAMIVTIKNSTAYYIFEDDVMKELVNKIEKNEEILLVTIDEYTFSRNKNFLNLIEENKYDDFWKALLKNYSIKINPNNIANDIYVIDLSQFLINYKYEFFKLAFDNQDTLAIYKEVLKIDNIMDILKKINLKTEEFNNIKNLFLKEHIKINAVYKKNREESLANSTIPK